MAKSYRLTFLSLNKFCRTIIPLTILIFSYGCSAQSQKENRKSNNPSPKVIPESLHFTAHITEYQRDGTKIEMDTVTGYRKFYYRNDTLQMEGRVTKASPEEYRDGIWNYYNEDGWLMRQETYGEEGKLSELVFMYFTNGEPFNKTYQYFEGDYKDKSTFKMHRIETLFYTNGQEMAERHWINNSLVDERCWDSEGNPRPIEYLNTVESVDPAE